ncbi:MAG: hypothetical protein AAF446_01090 [Pseudomonadota bacterium]
MKLQQLTIERLPGIERTLEVRLPENRVAVIIGANASGKSSLIRALKTLLERKPKTAAISIQAEFNDDGQRIEGSALGAARNWRVDGREADRPDWPDAEQLDAYLIRADDLVDPGQTEEQISTALKQVLSGGIDLDGLLANTPFKTPARPAGLKSRLEALDRQIRALEDRYAELTTDFDGLTTLRAQHQQAAEAERRLSLLQRALEWLDIRRKIEVTQAALGRMPEGMQRLRGHEAEDLQALDQERADKQQSLDIHQSQLQQTQAELDRLQIDDIEQTRAWRDDLAAIHKHLQDAETRLNNLKEQRADTQKRLEHAAGRAGGLESQSVRALSPDILTHLETAIVQRQTAQIQADDLRAQIDWRSRDEIEPDAMHRTSEGVDFLRNWLALPPTTTPAWLLWSLLLVACIAGGGWLWSTQQIWAAAVCATAALLPLSHLLGLGLRALRSRKLKSRYQALELESPERWRKLEAQQCLKQLERKQAEIARQQADLESAERLSIQFEQVEQEVRQYQQQIDRIAADFDLKTETLTDASAALRLRALLDWQQADSTLHGLDARIKTVQATINGLLGTAGNCLKKIQASDAESIDVNRLDGYLQRIDRTLANARELRERKHAIERSIEQIGADLQTLNRRHQRLFEDAGLALDATDELHRRLEFLQAFKQQSEQLQALEFSAQEHQTALRSEPNLIELTMNQDEQALTALQLDLQQQAEQRDPIKERISNIENRYSDAMQRRELEPLIGERESVRRQLNDALDQQRMAAAGRFLLQRIQQEQHQQHQPALLKRAMHWFARFTHSRYALKFDGQHFSAMDHQLGQQRSIAELSTATRVQLKLALRLAWIDQLGAHRPALPIILDEVLATSDPERYRAVVEAAQELIREGRQVVYLSAQPMDAGAWQQFAGEPEPAILELHSFDNLPEIDFALPETRPIPDASLEPEQWARQANVGPIDPWQAVESIDLFHLLRDRLTQLIDLRQRGIASLGQLEQAMALEPIEVDLSLQPRITATKAWLQRWRLGQVRPLDGITLAESGLVSDTYLEGVTAICAHVDGNARALIDTLNDAKSPLKIAGFAKKKTELLAQWLSENGYLDELQPAQDFELIDAMIQAGPLEPDQANELHRWLHAGIIAHHN